MKNNTASILLVLLVMVVIFSGVVYLNDGFGVFDVESVKYSDVDKENEGLFVENVFESDESLEFKDSNLDDDDDETILLSSDSNNNYSENRFESGDSSDSPFRDGSDEDEFNDFLNNNSDAECLIDNDCNYGEYCINYQCERVESSDPVPERECDEDSDCGCDYYSDDFCVGDDIYRTLHDFGCELNNGVCEELIVNEFIESCVYGCANGDCMEECVIDDDCGDDGFIGDRFCIGEDAYQEYEDFDCSSGSCESEINERKVENCAFGCSDGICNEPECVLDSDCGDNYSEDRYCVDDDIYRTLHVFGCGVGECFEEIFEEFIDSCDYGCENGVCLEPECVIDDDCGTDGFIGDRFCIGEDAYQEYEEFSCGNNECSSEIDERRVEECAFGCSDGICNEPECVEDNECEDDYYEDNYCVDDDIYRTLHDFGCDDGSCQEQVLDEFIFACEFGCENGECKDEPVNPECVIDDDCGEDYYEPGYCLCGDVYAFYHDFGCVDGNCEENILHKLMEDCEFGCTNGVCNDEPITPKCDECGEDFYSGLYCVGNEVYRDFNDFGCRVGSECELETTSELIDECEFGCENGECKDEPVEPECVEDSDCGEDYYEDSYCINEINTGESSVFTRFHDFGCVDGFCEESLHDVINACEFGCEDGECTDEPIEPACSKDSDCGVSWLGANKFCENSTVYQNHFTPICNNPGLADASCSFDAGFKIIEDCEFGCEDGECTDEPECVEDDDCGDDGYVGERFCVDENIYQNYKEFDCGNNECSSSVEEKLIESCEYGCEDGECKDEPECVIDEDCGEDYEDRICMDGDVYDKVHDFGCLIEGICEEQVFENLVSSCEFGCYDGECIDEPSPYIIKTGPENVDFGEMIIYNITVKSPNPDYFGLGRIYDKIPEGLIFNSSESSPECYEEGENVQCDVEPIGVNVPVLTYNLGFDFDDDFGKEFQGNGFENKASFKHSFLTKACTLASNSPDWYCPQFEMFDSNVVSTNVLR